MFRFPSVSHLKNEFARALYRFPLTSAIVTIATVIISVLIENKDVLKNSEAIVDFLTVLALGLPISVSFQMIAENKPNWIKLPKQIIPLLSLIPMVAFYLWRRSHQGNGEIIRILQWSLYGHLLVSFAPFLSSTQPRAFWNFNYRLFSSFLTSRFFGGFLVVGLLLALKATSALLEVDIDVKAYFHLCNVGLVFISTIHFLALVPNDPNKTSNENEEPPKILKIFCQYILVPLNAVYIFILYAYMIKIMSSGLWPKGMISWLVSAAAILGVFALLMMNSFFHQEENKWMKKFQMLYYVAIIPLLIMGLVSIGQRVQQYQLTEKRYILILLCLWLIGIAIYNLISKVKNIVAIPVSLFILTLLTSFGPWGIYQVSWRSQASRLENLLHKYGALKDGIMIKNETEFSADDAFELKEALTYLISSHGTDKIPELFSSDDHAELVKISKNKGSYTISSDVEKFMRRHLNVPQQFNKNFYSRTTALPQNFYAEYNAELIEPDVLFYRVDSQQTRTIDIPLRKKSYQALIDNSSSSLVLREDNTEILNESLKSIINQATGNKDTDADKKIKVNFKNEFIDATFMLNHLYALDNNSDNPRYALSGTLIVRLLKP